MILVLRVVVSAVGLILAAQGIVQLALILAPSAKWPYRVRRFATTSMAAGRRGRAVGLVNAAANIAFGVSVLVVFGFWGRF